MWIVYFVLYFEDTLLFSYCSTAEAVTTELNDRTLFKL